MVIRRGKLGLYEGVRFWRNGLWRSGVKVQPFILHHCYGFQLFGSHSVLRPLLSLTNSMTIPDYCRSPKINLIITASIATFYMKMNSQQVNVEYRTVTFREQVLYCRSIKIMNCSPTSRNNFTCRLDYIPFMKEITVI